MHHLLLHLLNVKDLDLIGLKDNDEGVGARVKVRERPHEQTDIKVDLTGEGIVHIVRLASHGIRELSPLDDLLGLVVDEVVDGVQSSHQCNIPLISVMNRDYGLTLGHLDLSLVLQLLACL
jgi:hypothetical protein